MSDINLVVNRILEGVSVRQAIAEDAKDDMRAEKLKTQDPKFSAKMSRSITDRAKWNRRLEAIKRICGEDSPQAIAFAEANPSMNDNPEPVSTPVSSEEPVVSEPAAPAGNKDLMKAIRGLKYKVSDDGDHFTVTCNDNGYSVTETAPGVYTLKHLYSRFEESGLDFDKLIADLEKQVGEFEYGCGFGVTGFIHPGRERDAADYLSDDNMEQYYSGDQAKDIVSIVWNLHRKQSGTIEIETTARLKKQALNDLKSFIDGQNSDGLGEGFEQQDFITMQYPGETIEAGNIYKYSGFASTH